MSVNSIHQKQVKHLDSASKSANKQKPQHIVVPVGQKTPFSAEKVAFEKMKKTVSSDLGSGVLTRGDNLTLGEKVKKAFGKKVDEYVVFHADKYKEKNSKKLTYGEIAKRYNLKPGELKKANDLGFGAYQMDKRGEDLNQYYPDEIGGNEVRIPLSSLKKYFDAM